MTLPHPLARRTALSALIATAAVAVTRGANAAPVGIPPWRRNALPVETTACRPAIAIIIDDMGATHPLTERCVRLPGPLTMSWFPFAPNLPAQIAAAREQGHEATLHMPMQSFSNSTRQTGPDPLRVDLPPEVNLARLRAAFDAVPDIVGLNNHMGCVATRSVPLMDLVAAETKARGMLFVDSVTIPHSVAAARHEAAGVPTAARDVFIDYANEPGVVRGQLATIETFARRYGFCIAIGHPRPHTVAALEEWLPTLDAKGFDLWPISKAVAWRNGLELTGVSA